MLCMSLAAVLKLNKKVNKLSTKVKFHNHLYEEQDLFITKGNKIYQRARGIPVLTLIFAYGYIVIFFLRLNTSISVQWRHIDIYIHILKQPTLYPKLEVSNPIAALTRREKVTEM